MKEIRVGFMILTCSYVTWIPCTVVYSTCIWTDMLTVAVTGPLARWHGWMCIGSEAQGAQK